MINPPSGEVMAAVLDKPADEAVLSLGKDHCHVSFVTTLVCKHNLVREQRIK